MLQKMISSCRCLLSRLCSRPACNRAYKKKIAICHGSEKINNTAVPMGPLGLPALSGMLHATSCRLLGRCYTSGKLHDSYCRRLAPVSPFCRQTESLLNDRRQSHTTASSRQSHLVSEDTQPPASAYVHLPFCKRRCYYCDFPVSVVGSRPEQPGIQQGMQDYINTLCKEIEATVKVPGPPLQTIFFGGGTPTLVPPNLLQQILSVLDAKYGIAKDAEISMESDPGTFDANRLLDYMSLGVNRFSMGVQCFQQNLLELCGRSHSLSDVYQAIDDIHEAGVQNWSLDLISGLPQLTSRDWQQSLQNAISANPAHISVYDLQVSCVMLIRSAAHQRIVANRATGHWCRRHCRYIHSFGPSHSLFLLEGSVVQAMHSLLLSAMSRHMYTLTAQSVA